MFKKLLLIGLGAAGALAVTNAVWSGSVSTAWKKARSAVSRQVSPEFEIERIRGEIAKLTPEMNKHIERIADATVECASLQRRIDVTRGELDKRQKDILALTEKVEKGIIPVGYTGTSLKDRLGRDLKAYKACERAVENNEKLLVAKQQSLESARAQLRTIHESRTKLEVEVAQLEAELQTVRAVQAESKMIVDDSRLGAIKNSIGALRDRIEGERIRIELTGKFVEKALDVETTEPAKDVVAEVREMFSAKKSDSTAGD